LLKSLVEASDNHYKATAVVKEVMAIKKLLESPFAGKHPKPISNGTKVAAARRQWKPPKP
jgi:hypothetical protein